MTINTEEKPISMTSAYAILLVFLLLGIVFVIVPINFFIDMLGEINAQAQFVYFYKGAYYLFGGGLVLLLIVLGLAIPKIVNKSMSPGFGKIYITAFIGSFVLVFILPNIIYYIVDDYLLENKYLVCEEKSTQWLHNKTIVYSTKSPCVDK